MTVIRPRPILPPGAAAAQLDGRTNNRGGAAAPADHVRDARADLANRYRGRAGVQALFAGYAAYGAAEPRGANPFTRDGEAALRAEWIRGWDMAERAAHKDRPPTHAHHTAPRD